MSRKFKRQKVYTRFYDNILAVDLAAIGSLSSEYQGVKDLLCAIHVFTKYARDKPLKDRKVKAVLNSFIKIINESKHKLNRKHILQ